VPVDHGAALRQLHRPGDPFILANAWDLGSAKMLVARGAQAIGTSSAAHAFTLGLPDGELTRDQALDHAQALISAVNVPVSGDFENGFGDSPDSVAETVRLAADIGLAGISIEDTALPADTPYGFDLAVERIRAGVDAARSLPKDFVFVARADGILRASYDIKEALRRIAAFDQAGADCLYVPMPASVNDLQQVIASTDKPVNALVAGPYCNMSRATFAQMGVARISLGSSLARVVHRTIDDAGRAMFDTGDFSDLAGGMSGAVVDKILRGN